MRYEFEHDEIDGCHACPCFTGNRRTGNLCGGVCLLVGRKRDDGDGIPEWCQLRSHGDQALDVFTLEVQTDTAIGAVRTQAYGVLCDMIHSVDRLNAAIAEVGDSLERERDAR